MTADKCWFFPLSQVSTMCGMEGVAMKPVAQPSNSIFMNLILQIRPHFLQKHKTFQEILTDRRWNRRVTVAYMFCSKNPLSYLYIQLDMAYKFNFCLKVHLCKKQEEFICLHKNDSAMTVSECFKTSLHC